MKIRFKKKSINVPAKKVGFWGKLSGLMFRTKDTPNLLFEFHPCEITTIHSFFVFFPFLALWLDKDNRVLEWNFVKPFTLAVTPKKSPTKLVEIPLNEKNCKITRLFVDKKKTFKYHRG